LREATIVAFRSAKSDTLQLELTVLAQAPFHSSFIMPQ